MKYETEVQDNRQVTLTVEVDQERVDSALKAAARKLSRRTNIPGFRKGKAPYHIIVSQFGEGALYDEALEALGQDVYREALEETDLEPYAPGSLDDVQLKPMVMTFTVPLRPSIELGNYRKVRKKKEKVKVTKEDVEEALEALRAEQAALEPVERPVQLGDVGNFDLKGTLAGTDGEEPQTFVEREDRAILIDEGTTYPLPGFAEAVVGISAGDERQFSLAIPEDMFEDETLAGQDVAFEVKCLGVKQRDLPTLDDEFAQSVGDFETVKALRSHVEEDLQAHAQRRVDEAYADEVLDAILEDATIQYPPVMLDEWIHDRIHDFEASLMRNQNITLEDYFRIADSSMEALHEEMHEGSEEGLRRALAIGKLAETEQLDVADEEIEDEIKTMLLGLGQQASLAKHFLESRESRNEIRNSLLIQKVRERLVEIGAGNAPPLEEKKSEPEAEPAEAAANAG